MSSLLLRGFVLGFAVAASPGPIFFLCLRRTLARGCFDGTVRLYDAATGREKVRIVVGEKAQDQYPLAQRELNDTMNHSKPSPQCCSELANWRNKLPSPTTLSPTEMPFRICTWPF